MAPQVLLRREGVTGHGESVRAGSRGNHQGLLCSQPAEGYSYGRFHYLGQRAESAKILLNVWRAMIIITIHLSDTVTDLLCVVGMLFNNKCISSPYVCYNYCTDRVVCAFTFS